MGDRDQAATLRRIGAGSITSIRPRKRTIAVTGGKGGVGKSTISVNLAACAAKRGKTVAVDGDLGMADLNLLMGLAPSYSISDVLAGMPVEEVLIAAHGMHLLPALNGSAQLAELDAAGRAHLVAVVQRLMDQFDTVVVDTAAGIAGNVMDLTRIADEVVVVVTPEPTSIADAYGCLKVLSTRTQVRHVYVLPNSVRSPAEAEETTGRLGALVARFLDLELTSLPAVPYDRSLSEAAAEGIPCVLKSPESPASRALRRVYERLEVLSVSDDRSRASTRPDLALVEG